MINGCHDYGARFYFRKIVDEFNCHRVFIEFFRHILCYVEWRFVIFNMKAPYAVGTHETIANNASCHAHGATQIHFDARIDVFFTGFIGENEHVDANKAAVVRCDVL